MAEDAEKRPFRAASAAAKRVGLPLVAIAAFALLLVHHFARRKSGGGKKLGKGNASQERENGGGEEPENEEDNVSDSSSLPRSLDELRSRRIRAMDARLARGVKANDPSVVRLTPLGTMLQLSRKVDEVAEQVTALLEKSKPVEREDCAALAECLKQLQLEIGAVKIDESVRDIRKAQAVRVDSLLKDLQRGLALSIQAMFSWFKCFFSQPVTQKIRTTEEDLYKTSAPLTLRKDASVAEWSEATGMATVTLLKGKMWNNTGVTRKGQLLCHVEEAVFLVEHGCLILESKGAPMKLDQVFELLSVARHGCTLEAYQVYSHLKALGYALARHGVDWTDKGTPARAVTESDEQRKLRPMFDVYPPNSRFKKTAPPSPSFSVCVSRNVPSRRDIKSLERGSQVPIKFAVVHGRHVGIFSFSNVELPLISVQPPAH